MSRMEEDQRKRKEDEESVLFHHKLHHKDHVKNGKICGLCNHLRQHKLDRYYCDTHGKDISDADSACDSFEPKL
jgi:hypothetical protein